MRGRVTSLFLSLGLLALLGGPLRGGEPATSPEVEIAGRVVDAAGSPVPDVSVEVRRARTWQSFDAPTPALFRALFRPASARGTAFSPDVRVTRTGEDGRFRTAGPATAPGTYLVVRARPSPPDRGTVAFVGAGPVGAGDVVLRVLPGRVLRGRLVDESGKGVEGRVSAAAAPRSERLAGVPGWNERILETDLSTDAEGRFELRAPVNADVWIDALVPGAFAESAALCVGDADEAVVVAPRSGRAVVRGVVEDTAGAPVPGARVLVSVSPPSAWEAMGRLARHVAAAETDAEGRFSVSGLPPGLLGGVSVEAKGYLFWSRPLLPSPLDSTHPHEMRATLLRPGQLVAHVHGPGGEAVAGARVTATRDPGALVAAWSETATSDEHGVAVLEDVPPGHGTIRTEADAWAEPSPGDPRRTPFGVTYVLMDEGATSKVDVPMVPAHEMRLVVVDTHGAPLPRAGVRASVYRQGDRSVLHVETISADARGAVRIGDVPPDASVDVQLYGPGVPPLSTHVAAGAPTDEPLRIVVPDQATVGGRVLDPDGHPLEGVAVSCDGAPASTLFAPGNATSDADGRFRIDHVLPGRRRVRVCMGSPPRPGEGDGEDVLVGPGEKRLDLVLHFAGKDVIAGRIVGPDGTGVPGVNVQARNEETPTISVLMVSGCDGRFRFERMLRGRYSVSAGAASSSTESGTEEASTVELRLPAPAPSFFLAGRIVDPDGRPVDAASVTVAEPGDGAYTARATAQAVGGAFQLRVPGEPREVVVRVREATDATGRRLNALPTSVTVPASPTAPVVVVLERGSSIRGWAFDERGKPVAGIRVRAWPTPDARGRWDPQGQAGTATAEDGSFALEGLRPISYSVNVETGAKWVPIPVLVVTPPAKGLEIALRRWRTLAVHVVDPEGAPVAGASVAIRPAEPRPNVIAPNANGTTSGAGVFRIARMPPDTSFVATVLPPDVPEAADLLAWRQRVPRPDASLEVRLERGLRIDGTVVDREGAPVPGARVSLRVRPPAGDGRGALAVSRFRTEEEADDRGRFLFRPFPADALVDLQVRGPKSAEADFFPTERKEVRAGSEDLQIVLERAVAIEGTVVGAEPPDLSGLTVRADPVQPGARGGTFRFDGTTAAFRLNGLRSGPYRVRLYGGRDLRYAREIVVEAPKRDLVVRVKRLYWIAGALLGAGGDDFQVEVGAAGKRVARTQVGRDGVFSVHGLEAPRVSLLVHRKGDVRVAFLEDVSASTAEPFVIELGRGRTIRGRVSGLPGPVVDGKVRAVRDGVALEGTLQADGTFETPPLPAGRYRLEVTLRYPTNGRVVVPEEVEAGTQDLVLAWERRD